MILDKPTAFPSFYINIDQKSVCYLVRSVNFMVYRIIATYIIGAYNHKVFQWITENLWLSSDTKVFLTNQTGQCIWMKIVANGFKYPKIVLS